MPSELYTANEPTSTDGRPKKECPTRSLGRRAGDDALPSLVCLFFGCTLAILSAGLVRAEESSDRGSPDAPLPPTSTVERAVGSHLPGPQPAARPAANAAHPLRAANMGLPFVRQASHQSTGDAASAPASPKDVAPAAGGSSGTQSKPVPATKHASKIQAASLPDANRGGSKSDRTGSSTPPTSGLQSLFAVLGSLGIVLGIFFIGVWLMRRATPGHYALLPKDVVEVLGRAPLAARQQVHLIRFGGKLVLISVTPGGVEALSEVTDPAEVEHLVGLCRQAQPNSATAVFRNVLQQFNREHERPGSDAPKGRRTASAKEANDA